MADIKDNEISDDEVIEEEAGETKTIVLDSIKDVDEQKIVEEEVYDEDEEEYEYVTPHYFLNATLVLLGSFIVGVVVVCLVFSSNLTESIKQQYLDMGYMKTDAATATASDIAEGKTAYVNGELVVGTYVEVDTSVATATAEDILYGYTAYVNGEKITGTIPTISDVLTITPSTSNTVINKGYYLDLDEITIKGDKYLTPSNIKEGITIFEVTGTYSYGDQ